MLFRCKIHTYYSISIIRLLTLTPNATINVGSSYQINSSVTTNIVSSELDTIK